ncbi:host specificity protein J [Chitiniphilus shinanonensis]|uniref:host specificity protein J n=1 Tax=Chitiniphilus shinanonensis TaxID=553088 RepID=UPI00302C88E1
MLDIQRTDRPDLHGAGGGKGGGGKGRVPKEDADSLRSRDYARVIDLVSEGEIHGLVDGQRSIYLNEVPLQNADGSFNFNDVKVEYRSGTPLQEHVAGFAAVENETQVQVRVKHDTPVVRSIAASEVDAVRLRIVVPQLTQQDMDDGDIHGSQVEIAIDAQAADGPWVERLRDTIKGKTTSRYARQYRVELTGEGPWNLRVRRLTADSASAALSNETWWDSYTEVIDAKLRYPHSALVALEVDASQFNSVPRRAYHLRGLLIQVPSNYDPVARSYAGIWDGSFKPAWSNNPAWVWYDLATNERYGLGRYIKPGMIDKWALYEVARYCDQRVPDGFGGHEPRMTCNLYLQTRAEAFQVLQDLASVFRGISYWAGGQLTAIQDAPRDAEALFTHANVMDGRFRYTGSSRSQRHTVALVGWNDPAQQFQRQVEYVADDAAIQTLGVNQIEVSAFGCTSRGQAHRVGKWYLYSERMEAETVDFRCGADAAYVRPGAIVRIADRKRAGKRAGGRVVSASASEIVVDRYEPVGGNERLHLVQPDGQVVDVAIASVDGNRLRLAAPLAQAPVAQAVWTLSSDVVPETLWRVLSVTEAEPGVFEISALAHRADKFDHIDHGLQLEPVVRPALDVLPPPPDEIRFSEIAVEREDRFIVKLVVGWPQVKGAREYRYRYRWGSGNWVEGQTVVAGLELVDVDAGTFELQVGSIGVLGVAGRLQSARYVVAGEGAPPPAVSGLALEEPFAGTSLRATWNRVPRAVTYQVRLERLDGTRVREQFIGDVLRFDYTLDAMRADGGPWRSLRLKVRAFNARNQSGDWAELVASNPQPAAPRLKVDYAALSIRTVIEPMADPDIAGYRVHISERSDFVATDANLVYDGPTPEVLANLVEGLPLRVGSTYYVRAGAYDCFGKDGIHYSPAYPVTVTALSTDVLALFEIGPDKLTPELAESLNGLNGLLELDLPEALAKSERERGQLAVAQAYALLGADQEWEQRRQLGSSMAGVRREVSAMADELQAEATERTILAAQLADDQAALVVERQARVDADGALTQQVTTLDGRVAQNAGWISDVLALRISPESALAQRLAQLEVKAGDARAKADDILQLGASVQGTTFGQKLTSIEATNATQGSTITALQQSVAGLGARWAVTIVDKGPFGKKVSGVSLTSDDSGASSFDVLADVFRVSLPDGSGSKPVFAVGSVNGVSTVGIHGNLLVDGSIGANALSVQAMDATLGRIDTLESKLIRNAAFTNYINMRAFTGQWALNFNEKVRIAPNGDAYFDGVVISRPTVIATGEVDVNLVNTKVQGSGIGQPDSWTNPEHEFEYWIDTGYDDDLVWNLNAATPSLSARAFVTEMTGNTGNAQPTSIAQRARIDCAPTINTTFYVTTAGPVGNHGRVFLRCLIRIVDINSLATNYAIRRIAWALFKVT